MAATDEPSMIARAALALEDTLRHDVSGLDPATYREAAMRMLRAIREPSEAMKMAGEYDDNGPPGASKFISDDDAEAVWRRMIDAVLAEASDA